MSARRWISPLAVACALLPTVASAGPWLPMPGEYYTEFSVTHGSSNSFFDVEGVKHPYNFGVLSESREFTSYNEIGWKKRVSLALSIPVRSVSLRSDLPGVEGTQTGLADLLIGLRAKLKDGETAVAFEAAWQTPMGYYRDAFPALGAGVQNLGGRVVFGTGIPTIQGFLELGFGYVYRSEEALDRMIHNANLGVWATPSLLVSARYLGSNYVGSSAKSALESDSFHLGPEIRYRLDDRMDVFGGASYTLAGRNADRTDEYFVGFAVKRTRLDRLQGYLGGKHRP